MKMGSGKYKGKLPFKCFNCGKIGHFAAKCPHIRKEQSSADEEKIIKKRYSKENKYKKKSLCVNDDDESTETSESESSHENKENDFMLMAIEDLEMSCTEMNDEDAIVDMEGEPMSALEEIDRLRIKKTKQK